MTEESASKRQLRSTNISKQCSGFSSTNQPNCICMLPSLHRSNTLPHCLAHKISTTPLTRYNEDAKAAINVLSDISCSLLYWDWGSESIKETPNFHLLLRPFAELLSANGLNLRLQIFLSQYSSTSSLCRLSLSRIPAADDGILNPTEFLANPSRIPNETVTDEVARWIWPISVGISCSASPLLSPFSTTTCLTGSHTQTRRGAIFKPSL